MSDDEFRVTNLPGMTSREARLQVNARLPVLQQEAAAHAAAAMAAMTALEGSATTRVGKMTAEFTRRKSLNPALFITRQLATAVRCGGVPSCINLDDIDSPQGLASLRLVARDGRRGKRQQGLYHIILDHVEAIYRAAIELNDLIALRDEPQ